MAITTAQFRVFGGGNIMPLNAFSADATLDEQHYTVVTDVTGGNVTITLPPAANFTGKIYVLKRNDSSGNTLTIDTTGSDTIDASASITLAALACNVVQSDGETTWHRIASF